MYPKKKLLLRGSLLLNVLLVAVLVWVYMSDRLTHQSLLSDVQHSLVELDGVIAHQIRAGWNEPDLVTIQLGRVLDRLSFIYSPNVSIRKLPESELRLLSELNMKLRQYPRNLQYEKAIVSQKDQVHFEALRSKLREADIGLQIQMDHSITNILSRLQTLEKSMEYPLQ